jgi:outer membrane protein OmpA-like peptidoglycan-associated protein
MRAQLLLPLALAAAGCATSSVTLLPGEGQDGTGAVAVLDASGNEVVLDRPLTSGTLSRGPARVREVKSLKPAYNQLLGSLPPASARFTLNFITGTATITPESRPTLDLIRREVAARPGAEVEVVGHTDTVGAEEDNDRLSEQRAGEVVKELIAEGFPADLLRATGRGERDLKVATADNMENEQNRRVEVVVR